MKIIMTTTTSDYQNNLLKIVEHGMRLYNSNNYATLYEYLLEGQNCNCGIIKAFTYGNSLRFKILFDSMPQVEDLQFISNMIKQTCEEKNINKVMLWYSQRHDKLSDKLLKLLPVTGEPYYFSEYVMPRNTIKTPVDSKGLSSKLYTEDMLGDCINILESAFTPLLDPPGTFINEKDRINKLFQLTGKARCEVFYLGENYVILNDSNNLPYLCCKDKNVRAQRFYERAGMKKICSSVRTEILWDIYPVG